MNDEQKNETQSPYVYEDAKDRKHRITQIAGFSVITAVIIGTAAGTGALAAITPEPIKHFLHVEEQPKVVGSISVDASAASDSTAASDNTAGDAAPLTPADPTSSSGASGAPASASQQSKPNFDGGKGKHILVPPTFIKGGDDSDDDEESEDESDD